MPRSDLARRVQLDRLDQLPVRRRAASGQHARSTACARVLLALGAHRAIGWRAVGRAVEVEHERGADDGDGGHGHGEAGEHGRDLEPKMRVEEASGEGDAWA